MPDNDPKVFAIILDNRLESGRALNASAHLAAQFGTLTHDIKGSAIVDRSGITHLGLPIWGNVILSCPANDIAPLLELARKEARGDMNAQMLIIDFPEEGFTTSSDEELVAQLSAKDEKDITYRAFLLYGPKALVRKITRRLKLWK
jgi:hypothetical protein